MKLHALIYPTGTMLPGLLRPVYKSDRQFLIDEFSDDGLSRKLSPINPDIDILKSSLAISMDEVKVKYEIQDLRTADYLEPNEQSVDTYFDGETIYIGSPDTLPNHLRQNLHLLRLKFSDKPFIAAELFDYIGESAIADHIRTHKSASLQTIKAASASIYTLLRLQTTPTTSQLSPPDNGFMAQTTNRRQNLILSAMRFHEMVQTPFATTKSVVKAEKATKQRPKRNEARA